MKHICTILFLCFTISLFSFAQTEQWRIDGEYGSAVRDSHGKIYLTQRRLVDYSPDTLKKITPDGILEWQQELNRVPQNMLSSGSGVYILFLGWGQDSVTYFDTLGTHRWTYIISGVQQGIGAVDQSGNLFLMVQPMSGSPTLIKLDTTGTKKFQVPIPWISMDGIEEQYSYGPYVDQSGNVLVLTDVMTHTEKYTSSGGSTIADYGYTHGWKFNGSNGQILNPNLKPYPIVKKDLIRLEKDNGTGSYTNFDTRNYPYLISYGFANGKFVMAGSYMYEQQKGTLSKESSVNLSEWRIVTLDQKGKSKMKKYKGKGLDVCKDEGFSSKNDMEFNLFYELVVAKGDTVYLSGTVARGKSTCGEPELRWDGVLMKYNVAKNKIVWVKTFADEDCGMFIIIPSQKILRRVGENTMQIYDGNGNPGMTTLNFTDHILWEQIREINTEDGTLYLNMYGPSGFYFAKYSLPPLEIMPGAGPVPYEETPYTFALEQNHPNPFNPQTTIRFILPAQSMVTLKVFNMLGQDITTVLNNEEMDEGEQEIEFNAQNIASGVYFYRLEANGIPDEGTKGSEQFVSIRKMILVR